jgi:hypothetical protein
MGACQALYRFNKHYIYSSNSDKPVWRLFIVCITIIPPTFRQQKSEAAASQNAALITCALLLQPDESTGFDTSLEKRQAMAYV